MVLFFQALLETTVTSFIVDKEPSNFILKIWAKYVFIHVYYLLLVHMQIFFNFKFLIFFNRSFLIFIIIN